ncbi:MarR family transcriptional regulator [Clostridium sp. MSJ-11]|uniref:MarR family transcriptional regulator n=1 Tax=Clostridium mobile TaxID=2841512 RepID=A0ABS6EJJ0_9CLOT|nr:MarR family transcriptional regulator [Clostridium mobile]MBU5485218.1 MarR family transcriptional regulator [Clostridium mobile]
MADTEPSLSNCLYFTVNKLSRVIGKMAEEEFEITGLSPTYALLINIVNVNKGVGQKEIGEALHMTPSTITRFIDKLEVKGLVIRKCEGKNCRIYPTEKGQKLQPDIDKAWSNLHERYSKILSYEKEKQLIETIDKIGIKLEENF